MKILIEKPTLYKGKNEEKFYSFWVRFIEGRLNLNLAIAGFKFYPERVNKKYPDVRGVLQTPSIKKGDGKFFNNIQMDLDTYGQVWTKAREVFANGDEVPFQDQEDE